MTPDQQAVLRWMSERDHGVVRYDDRWIWRQDVRQDATLAARMARQLESGGMGRPSK